MATVRVDVTFTEQRLRVQLNLQQVQGSVQVDRVEPQSAAHGRVTAGATLVAVNGTPIRPLMGRQAWVAMHVGLYPGHLSQELLPVVALLQFPGP